jgi:Ca-activated chloride channel family protein
VNEYAPCDDVQAGALVLYGEDDERGQLAPQLSQRVELRVTGLIARARVVQAFENQSDDIVHAVYTFPLPETAAVDGLTLAVGERRITGQIRERAAAQRSYEEATRQGHKASLIEQQRPNVFSTRVANIGPHETVEVELSYQQDVRYDAGTFALDFPATLTPRYAPAEAPEALDGVTPPFTIEDGPTLSLDVTLDTGFPLQRIASPSHALKVRASGVGPVHVSLAQGEVLADRDVRLEWAAAPDAAPRSALFEEQFGGERYALLMLLPPDPGLDPDGRLPRETTFIIDTSGSMSGTSIEQARLSLESGLAALRPADRFNVIQFDDSASAFFPGPVPATPEHVQGALRRVRQLEADGGTEMLAALDLAFDVAPASEALSQVVFVTDGSVGNEADVFRFIEGNLGPRRLFTVGIGSAPNQYFMRSAARLGRGTFTAVSDVHEVGARMQTLWTKLDAPLLRQVDVDFGGDGRAEVLPARVPDLYRGEPLVVVAKLGAAGPDVRVRGQRAGHAFDAQLPLGASVAGGVELGIHRLWARRQIEGLMDRIILGDSEDQIRPAVTALALQHRLLSKYTSLVAVDPARSVAGPGSDVAVPSAMPAGNTMFGNMPQTATPAPLYLIAGAASIAVAWMLRARRRPSAPLGRTTRAG